MGLDVGTFIPDETFATKKVSLPCNCKKLVENYKDIVPLEIKK